MIETNLEVSGFGVTGTVHCFPGLLNYIKANLICTNHIKTQWLSLKLVEPVAEQFCRGSNIEHVTDLFLLFYKHSIVDILPILIKP